MSESLSKQDTEVFVFWTPLSGMSLSVGEHETLPLPHIPLPVRAIDYPADSGAMPSERLIGEGIYAYLSLFPDCEHAKAYTHILHRAFPFLISDIGSQLLLLDLRSSDVAALTQKTALLKILLNLEPDNFGLLYKLGIAYFHLAVHPLNLIKIRENLTCARQWFEKARRVRSTDGVNLNYLGQICYLTGNYHQAKLYWQAALNHKGVDHLNELSSERLGQLATGAIPSKPLQQTLEIMGKAREYFETGDYVQAHLTMEQIVLEGDLTRELPSADLYYFIGLCREQVMDFVGAYEALMTALELNDMHDQARTALERVTAAGLNNRKIS